jgi:hypothetical protein
LTDKLGRHPGRPWSKVPDALGRPPHSYPRLITIREFNAGHFERAYDGSHVCAIWYMPAAFEILDRRPINASAGGEHRLAPIEKTSRRSTLLL